MRSICDWTVPFGGVRIRASDVAQATGGRLVGPDVDVDGASFDSRTLRPGQLFVPIVADRDGHDFIATALERGAAAYLTSRPAAGGTAIQVADTGAALLALAAAVRRRLEGTIVGITGSVGKTSTKDLVAATVGAGRRVAANTRSFNNEQGLPVTILDAPADVEVLVLEMGMRGFGEITRLCEVATPDVGVVTAVGMSHTERVGGIDGVARAKAELVAALPPAGTAVLNADDERVRAMAAVTRASVITYGHTAGADVQLAEVVLDALARPRFEAHTPWGRIDVRLAVSGVHMAVNAAAALAVAGIAGVELGAAADALGRAELSPNRMAVVVSAAGGVVIDDAYNANPTSMRAALDALSAMDADRRVAVLGLMAELDDPHDAHRAVAAHAATLGIELVAVGTERYGVPPVEDPLTAVGPVTEGTAVLVKASRVAGLEAVAASLVRSTFTR
jgi:UDP-N-acetylmuramoyl-tripeptide--D-alanyl-D-alanine ligase